MRRGIQTNGNQWIERVPAWTRLAWQDPNTNLFNGVMWQPAAAERYVFKHDRPGLLLSLGYCHILGREPTI